MYVYRKFKKLSSTDTMHQTNHEKEEKFSVPKKTRHIVTDFSKVGGLSNHIKILKDSIILPLLYSNIYMHFNIKTPRGLLFYGPPGTGKTLVAGALATEINREGLGKVSFFQRKGADVLDKWVGESEKKLRALFETATKKRPSIIFFDELDGLAPIRSAKNDHVHCSIVTTLLALMDGLDSVPGVIVIGATNRIESVDPALRRPGRFDRELYFPLPSTEARREILDVHMHAWKHKPSTQFLNHLAEITTGFCGSDLQALCAETLLCCMKRLHPNLEKSGPRTKIEADEIKIDECDFLKARRNMIPSSQKMGNQMRKLSPIVAPLLQRQLHNAISKMQLLWPHFSTQFYKYLIGAERYTGRIVLTGSNGQGLNSHVVPAILQHFEHLPAFHFNAAALQNRRMASNFVQNLPSVLVLSRIDDLWNSIDVNDRIFIASCLEDIHAGLPILVVATCEHELPHMLHNFFYNNTTIVVEMENPTEKEIEAFLTPLFFGDSPTSLQSVLINCKKYDDELSHNKKTRNTGKSSYSSNNVYKIKPSGKIKKARSKALLKNLDILDAQIFESPSSELGDPVETESLCTVCGTVEKKKRLVSTLTDLLNRSVRFIFGKSENPKPKMHRNLIQAFGDSSDVDKQKIYDLWKQTLRKTAQEMPVSQLEVLYDTIVACISIHKDNFDVLIKNLEETLFEIECSK